MSVAALIFAAAAAMATVPAGSPLAVSLKQVSVPASAGAPPMKQDLAGDPGEMVCKRIVSTGTRFAAKDCRTRSEWNQLSVDSRQATSDMTSRQNGFSN